MKIWKMMLAAFCFTVLQLTGCSVSEPVLSQDVYQAGQDGADEMMPQNVVKGGHQINPSIARDSAGHYVVVWLDYRNGVRSVYGKKIQTNGYTVWDDKKLNGTDLTINSSYNQTPKVALDPWNNIYIVFAQSSGNLRLRKLNASGAAVWEVRVDNSTYPAEWVNHDLAIDGSGNVYVVYQRASANGGGSFLAKYNSSGSRLWYNRNAGGIGNIPSIAVAGSYVFVAGNGTLARIDANGNTLWRILPGSGRSRIAADTSGNVYWTRTASYSVYYSRYNASGSRTAGPLTIASGTSTYPKDSQEIAINASREKFIVFRDRFSRSGTADYTIRGQKINSSEQLVWTAGGREICRADTIVQYTPDVEADPRGGLFAVWRDYRYDSTWYTWGNGLTAGGARYWSADLHISNPVWPPSSSSSSSVASSSSSSAAFDPAKALVLYAETIAQNVTWGVDINTNQSPSSPNVLSFDTTTAGEGTRSFKIKVNSNVFNVNWLRYPLVTYLDLSAYANGSLNFMVKAPKDLAVSIHVAENYDIMVQLTNGMYGFKNNNTWCTVKIPMSVYTAKGVDLTRLYGYLKFYGGYYQGITGGEEYFFDKVYFYKQ